MNQASTKNAVRFLSSPRRMTAAVVVIVLVCGSLCVLLAKHGPWSERGRASSLSDRGHELMLNLLASAKTGTASGSGQLGDADFNAAEASLDALPPNAPASDRASWLATAGYRALGLGKIDVAIEHYQDAYDLKPKAEEEVNRSGDGGSSGDREAARQRVDDFFDQVFFQLGVCYLRQGEVENCIHCRTGESCILPIRLGGVHTRQDGSRQAIKRFKELLARKPDHLGARWLLNVASMTVGGYPKDVPAEHVIPPSAFSSKGTFPRFTNVAADLGLSTLSLSGGSIADDFDNDGLLDVCVSSINGDLRYFKNNGDGTFTERTKEAGFEGLWAGLNIIQADYNNDGNIDILVLRGAWRSGGAHLPNSLLHNEGEGRFRDVTFAAGLGNVHYPTQTGAWGDFDNDGDLDLYIGNEDFPCQLFENDGRGHFTDVAARAGVENHRYTKGVVWGDFDNDRHPDLYVSNFGAPNRLYRNRGDGTFTDVAVSLGVQGPVGGFPVWFWDFNNDGALDIFAASYVGTIHDVCAHFLGRPHEAELDCLYQGDGRGGFREVAEEQGLTAPSLAMGANFGDLDNDGFPDFYLGTGNPEFESIVPNLMYRNRGGSGFEDVTGAGGFGHLQKGHGVSFADFDNDGDQDVFIELGGAFLGDPFGNALFENPGFGRHWIKLKLVGRRSNHCAIGARIRVDIEEAGVERSIFKWVNSGGSFGANPLRQEIGLGQATVVKRLEIYWPTSDTYQRFQDVAVDQFLEIVEGMPEYRRLPLKTFTLRRGQSSAVSQQQTDAPR